MANPVCVLDSGGWSTKAGFAGEVVPRSVFPTVVGKPRNQGVTIGIGGKECYVGHQCVGLRGSLNVVRPIRNGLVESWDDMEKLWATTVFDDLAIPPDTHNFLVTESAIQPLTAKKARETTTELFFETLAAEGFYLATNAVLSLYSAGLTTGIVLDSGHDLSLAVPVHEGYTLTRQISTSNIAGKAVTDYLIKLLGEKGYGLTTEEEVDVATEVKETMCYVRDAGFGGGDGMFVLPDGTDLILKEERHRCVESLFNTGIITGRPVQFTLTTETDEQIQSSVTTGISTLLYDSITQCELSLRPALVNNIVAAGGTTLIPGTTDRVLRDIYTLYREAHPTENTQEIIKENAVHANQNRHLSPWIGGSMLGMLSMFSHMLVHKKEYNEVGPAIVHTKCF
eukprot:TRINITY_DN9979_c0_g1_i2.p1 TRINITY_DN9979_c0_g1~~TRINITY_DN9979_c0_g1_i2.p1  ORF type:complete len:415 (+),score=53.98 TRINITY_DN9979_c0_g1_i2:59-1246(+)